MRKVRITWVRQTVQTCYCCNSVWYWRGPVGFYIHQGDQVWYCDTCRKGECGKMGSLGHDPDVCNCPVVFTE